MILSIRIFIGGNCNFSWGRDLVTSIILLEKPEHKCLLKL